MIAPLLLVSATAQMDACDGAVHGNLGIAETACAPPKAAPDALFEEAPVARTDSITPACKDALLAGVEVGKYCSRLPEPVKQGYIREFEKKLALCRNPAKPDVPPMIKTTNPWD